MPEEKKPEVKSEEDTSKIIVGKTEPKIVSTDSDGLDINTIKQAFVQLKSQYDTVLEQLHAREQEDAQTVRQVIINKTKDWKKPFEMQELKDASLEDLDQLHLFIQRAPDAVQQKDNTIVDKVSAQVVKARIWPKLTSDAKPYESQQHRFQIGK